MQLVKIFLHYVLSSTLLVSVLADISSTLYPYIYTNLNNWPCVRLLNATGTIGCHSLSKKSGILYQTNTQQDISDFVTANPSNDHVLVMPFSLLTKANLDLLATTNKVTGLIILLLSNDQPRSSPDSSCPNCQFGLYANDTVQYEWNPEAQNLIEQNFDFPIFAIRPEDDVSQEVYDYITESLSYNIKRHYKDYPLKAMDFDLFMWAAVNSETCLRRKWCQVVGGLSVFSSPSLDIQHDDDKPIIVVSAGIDSRSLFHDLTIGVSNDISGLVTVLAIAEALSRAPKPIDSLSKHVLYTLFTAESWGFAGSQRFVKDISSPFTCTNATRAVQCPYTNAPCTFPCVRNLYFTRINFEKIDSYFEFQSVSGINNNNNTFIHVDHLLHNQPLISALLKDSKHLKLASEDGIDRKLPPSSAMSFLQKKRDIKAVVISDYQKILGSYYNSDMDSVLDLSFTTNYICNLVNSTANTIYRLASNSTVEAEISANCTLISSLLDCLTYNFSCPLMKEYFNVTAVERISHYSSVYSFTNPQPDLLQRFAFNFLAGVTGKSSSSSAHCYSIQDCKSGEYCIKQKCTASFTTYHEAYGTGLQYDESTNKVKVIDPTKGTWTESTWNDPSVRIFSVISKTHQVVELMVGLIWTITSIIIVFITKKYLKKTLKYD
ncbi:Nicastrin-domain-containing protein [Cokeromyces recurvatus]|uniref:Nicastrin-domain-containing protein n=1 Tax=Cokeromyces recurvatus TaxID=90255 RepID=UPI00221E656E|nr:Nicastrin-domain-containing protein [Cokeromyces recurvatus]KAI7901564.1 Nicastrin-domain-containing protein [Cokeromyces recurvatus]